MSDSSVVFDLHNQPYPVQFPREHLQLGRLVYICFDTEKKPLSFSLNSSPGAQAYCVTWISPSEWRVMLEGDYDVPLNTVKQVSKAVGSHLDQVTVERALSRAAADIRLEHRYKSEEYERSRLSIVITVSDRLNLSTRLQRPEVSAALGYHLGSLCIYLLLTCFDRLGQPADWMLFKDWLTARRTESERTTALATLCGDADHLAAAVALEKAYGDRYGVRSSFFRFLREVLPPKPRQTLLSSIEIESCQVPPWLGKTSAANDDEKQRYLYKLRNDYTHRSQGRVTTLPDWFLPSDRPIAWHMQEQTFGAERWTWVRTIEWPKVLDDTVRIGLAAYLDRLAEESA